MRHRWFVVDARARIAMTAGADLEVEGTVNFVLFRSEYALQPLCHFNLLTVDSAPIVLKLELKVD